MKRKPPEYGFKLDDFLYADACPNCHEALKHNQAKPANVIKKLPGPRSWPVRVFLHLAYY